VTDEATLAREGRERRRQALPRRRAVTEAVAGGLFVAAAVVLAVVADADRDFEAGPTIVLVALFAAAVRVRIDTGVTYTTPVQLAFVPMLLLLPTPFVPLLVLLAWTLGRLPDLVLRDDTHPDRLLLIPGDSWFSLGPALVLVIADAQLPDASKWPAYLLALVAQFAFEGLSIYLREWAGRGAPPEFDGREFLLVSGIDALLAPLGLLAAFAVDDLDYAYLLLVPPSALVGLYARERTGRIENAVALAESARDREDLIAGASHELVTPLGVLVGLTGRLSGGRELPPDRRAEVDAVMRREVIALRQIVRQFVDYTRLKTDRDLQLRAEPVALTPLAEDVASALAGSGEVTVEAPGTDAPAAVDPDRAHQMVTAIAMEALEGTSAITLTVRAAGDAVVITATSPHPPRERPFTEGGEGSAGGLGLFVTRELARRQGGELNAESTPDGGARYVLTLPRAR
jgi:signal transduction histidine kinase